MSILSSLRQQPNILNKLFKKVYSNRNCSLVKLKCEPNSILLPHRCFSSKTQLDLTIQNDPQSKQKLFEFHHEWPVDVKNEVLQDMILIEDFVSESEEQQLLDDVKKAMRRMRYQYDHWDNAIHGYKEMEKKDWLPENMQVFDRLRAKAFVANVLPHVHILDLAADGIIKPHVDSSRYCGSTIAGISLLTDCIMRLKRVDEKKYEQRRFGEDEPTSNQPKEQDIKRDEQNANESIQFNYFVDVLLKHRSLYIMKDSARYKFSHEVLATKSIFKGTEIIKDRRVSIICRNQP